jgi:hypothetical protein
MWDDRERPEQTGYLSVGAGAIGEGWNLFKLRAD